VPYLSDPAALDDLRDRLDGGQAPEGEPDAVDPPGGVRLGREPVRLGRRPAERLFGQHVLAGREKPRDHVGVGEVRQRKADRVDGVVAQYRVEAGGRGGEAVPGGGGPGEVLVEVDDGGQPDIDAGQVGVHHGVAVAEGVGLPGHAGADDGDGDVLVHGFHPIPAAWRVLRVRAAMG
jgi:hypothetical protein